MPVLPRAPIDFSLWLLRHRVPHKAQALPNAGPGLTIYCCVVDRISHHNLGFIFCTSLICYSVFIIFSFFLAFFFFYFLYLCNEIKLKYIHFSTTKNDGTGEHDKKNVHNELKNRFHVELDWRNAVNSSFLTATFIFPDIPHRCV